MAEGSAGGGGGNPGGAGDGKGGDHPAENRRKISSNREGKVCKGCLYYSSRLRSKGQMPHCIGIDRSLQRVPDSLVRKYEIISAIEGRSATDFKYACFGFSMFLRDKDAPTEKQQKTAALPFCAGMKLLVDKTSTVIQEPHVHRKEDVPVNSQPPVHPENSQPSQPPVHKPQESSGDFFSKFNRNAGIVAYGVARNLLRVGYAVKRNLEEVMYPERRRPK